MTTLPAPAAAGSLLDLGGSAPALLIQRLGNPRLREDCAELAQNQAVTFNGWSPPSLYSGLLGTALLMLEGSRTDASLTGRAKGLLAESLSGQLPMSPTGLANSAPAALAVLALFAEVEPRYLPTLERQVEKLAGWAGEEDRPDGRTGTTFDSYDLVSGTAGTALALSLVAQLHPQLLVASLGPVLAELANLLRDWMLPYEPDGGPACWIKPRSSDIDDLSERYPDGHLNLGLSHGLAGVLRAAAAIRSVMPDCDAASETLNLASAIIDGHARREVGKVSWPSTVPRPGGADCGAVPPPDRMVWCYGSAGMAAALAQAGQLPGYDHLTNLAREAARSVASRFLTTDSRPSSPTVCHGLAGILLALDSVRRAIPDETVATGVRGMRSALEDMIEPGLPLGVQDIESTTGNRVDDPGLLTGSTGVALALVSTVQVGRPSWYSLLGI